jgi:hypothetical protein
MDIRGYAKGMLDLPVYSKAIRAGLDLAPMGFRMLVEEIAEHIKESDDVEEAWREHGDAPEDDPIDVMHMDGSDDWPDQESATLEEELPTDEDFALAGDLLAALGLKPGDASGFQAATGLTLPDGVEIIVPQDYATALDLPALLWREDGDGNEGLYTPIKVNLCGDEETGIEPRRAILLFFLRPLG